MIARVLAEADAPAFYSLRQRALREHPEAFGMSPEEVGPVEVVAERFRAETASSFVMGAFDPELVGIVGCVRERGVKQRHVALIWGMYVPPERRGSGVGRRLFTAAIEQARRWPDVEQLCLDVVTGQTEARALYQSCGFEVVGLKRRRIKVGDRYYDEEHMELLLR
ncbi:MAG: GNAT family N-acetyltransferase [Candidatus Rokuibacteriota bacterium]|nr:MAG: GNAT family N-acetyltransferase [Candidatus Rokubacteria bacterium]